MGTKWPVSCNILSRHSYFLSILIIGCHVCVSRTPSSFSLIAGRCWTWLTGWSHDVCCVTWLHNKNTRIWHYNKVVLSLKLARARLSFVLRLKGRGERIKFSLPSPSFYPYAYPKGCNFYTRLSSVVVKSKIATAALQVEATFAHLKIFLRTKHFCASRVSKAWDKSWLLNKVNSLLSEVLFFKTWLSSAQGELSWVIDTKFSNVQWKTQYIRYYYFGIILVVLIPKALKRQATNVKKVKLR